MATGGVFILITNDGKQDRMLMATQLLRARLDNIRAKRRMDPNVTDDTPTLLDIEKTHVLFTNAHFKPFAAIGYEYNKVSTTAGTAQFGQSSQFSIPQFGDFFGDMSLHVIVNAPVLTFTHPDPDDPALYPAARWCDYPGEKLLQLCSFEVNGNPLDQYTPEEMSFYRQFCVSPGKIIGYNKCMGQQNPRVGTLLNDQATTPFPGPPTHHAQEPFQSSVSVTDGPQTPKAATDLVGLEMFIPLMFWCNRDPRLAVPSVAIPYGQRFINVTLAPFDFMMGIIQRGGYGSAFGDAATVPSAALSTPTITTFELYINNVFMNPEVHQIYIKRIGFTLIRVHRRQNFAVSRAADMLLMSNLKWPIEFMFLGIRPALNITPGTTIGYDNNLANWWKFSKITNNTSYYLPNVASTGGVVDTTFGNPNQPILPGPSGVTTALLTRIDAPTIDVLTISAHGIPIYNAFPGGFFNAYIPFTYGGPNINTPDNVGALMVNFCLYPGTYQPSGHINISRAREFYVNYISSVIGNTSEVVGNQTGNMFIAASAINFLLISDFSKNCLKQMTAFIFYIMQNIIEKQCNHLIPFCC